MITYTLTWPEQLFAASAGVMRQISGINRGRPEPYGTPKDPWGGHVGGAGAELAVAKYLGLYWHAVDTTPGELPGDVGLVQVRWTARPDGRLILHDRDQDAAPFVLVRGTFPEYTLVGWILSHHGKRPEYKQPGDGRPAYFVPTERLESMVALLQGLEDANRFTATVCGRQRTE